MAIVAVLLAVLAEPRVQLQANDLAVAFLLDRSDSVTPSMQSDEERWLAAALQHKAPQDQAAVISFGRDPVVERGLSPDAEPPRLSPSSNVNPGATDIAAAIRAGLAVLPPSAADGMEAYVPNLEKVLIADSGHWTQQEKPAEVNKVLLDWMDRRFPK